MGELRGMKGHLKQESVTRQIRTPRLVKRNRIVIFCILALIYVSWQQRYFRRLILRSSTQAKSTSLEMSFPYVYGTAYPELDPYAEHPIQSLMRNARQEWDDKVARQSKTLNQAEDEYRRRHGLDPPPGFDHW